MLLGFICIVLASVAFGFSPVFATEIMASGMDAQSTLVFVNAFAALGSGIALLFGRNRPHVTRRQVWQLFVCGGASLGLTELLLVNSYRFIPIGLATMFHFVYPVVVSLAMVILYKEKVSVYKIAAILSALAGLYLILDLSGNLSVKGVALALSSGLAYAAYVVVNRKCAYRELPALTVVFYATLTCVVGFALYRLAAGGLMFPPSARIWLLAAGSGLISHLFALLMLITAVRRIGASTAATCNMLEPMTSMIAGAVIYSEKLPLLSLGGCVLMLLAILLIALDTRRAVKTSVRDAETI
jgi:drug/metabolite transporter (DMT)-like permease